MSISVKAKEWGNSIGVILPKAFVKQNSIKPGEELMLKIEKKNNVLKELFGSGKFSKPTDVLMKEVRKELDSKWV